MMASTLFTNSQVRSPGSDPFCPDSERPKNGHQKHMCYNEIRLCAHNILTSLGSIVNTIGRAYVII